MFELKVLKYIDGIYINYLIDCFCYKNYNVFLLLYILLVIIFIVYLIFLWYCLIVFFVIDCIFVFFWVNIDFRI